MAVEIERALPCPMRMIAPLHLAVAILAALLGNTPALAQSGAGDHYSRAVALLEQGLWHAAIAELDLSLKRSPEQAETHIAMGIALSNTGQLQEALASFETAVKLQPESGQARFNLGLALRNAGEVEKAIAELEGAIRLEPGLEQGRLELGLLLQRSGQWDRSVAVLEALLERNERSAQANHWLGIALQQRKEFGQAVARFRRATELDENLARAHNSLGTVLAETGSLKEAVAAFRKAVSLEPENLETRLNLAVALRNVGESEEAVEQLGEILRRAEASASSGAPVISLLAEVHHQVGQTRGGRNPAAAVAAYEEALGLEPEKSESYYGLGQALKRLAARSRRGIPTAANEPEEAARQTESARTSAARGDVQAARSEIERTLERFPDYGPAHSFFGYLLGRQDDLVGSVRHLRRAVDLQPESAEARYHLGLALWYQGQRTEATAELVRATEVDPAMAEACAALGMAFRERGESERARRHLQRAIALNRNLPAPYMDLGLVFLADGRGAEALGQFEAALNIPGYAGSIPDIDLAIARLRAELERNPRSPEAHNALGRLLGRAGADPQQVAMAFREAIRQRPEYPEALNNLGLVLTQTDKTDEAIEAFRTAVSLRPDYGEARANLGGVLVIVDPQRAIEELLAAIDLDPGLVNAHYNLSRAYNATGDRTKEVNHLQRAVGLDAGFARAHLALGRALVAAREVEAGVEHLQRALELDPKLGEARYQLGLALARAGRREEARRELQASRPLITEKQEAETATVMMREASAALEGGEVNLAIDKLRQITALVPTYVDAQLALGEAFSRNGDPAAAAIAYERASDLRPDSFSAFLGLGTALRSLGRDEEATAAFRDAVRLRPSAAEAHRGLGQTLASTGYEEEAIEALQEAVDLEPNDARSQEEIERLSEELRRQRRTALVSTLVEASTPGLGRVTVRPGDGDDPVLVRAFEEQIRQGNFEGVEARLRRYVLDNPESWWGFYALGYVTFAQKKVGDAIGALATSLQLNINSAETHKILGRVLMVIGQYDRARVEFEIAARLDPDSSEIRYNLGKLYSAQDDFPAARREFERALALDPDYMEAHNALGFALESMSLDSDALASYAKAIELSEERVTGFVAPYVNLAAYHNRQNDPRRALEFAQQAIRLDQDSHLAKFQAAKAYRANRQLEEAIDQLEAAIRINSRISRYHYVLGLLYRRTGRESDGRQAMAAFERLEREAADLEAQRRAVRRQQP